MTTNPTALKFISNASGSYSGSGASRTFGDHIGEYVYNVKSFGAKGDNSTIDTSAIQLCLDAAFQDTTFQNWSYSTLTRLVYFPAGIYLTDAPLLIPTDTHGGMIYGDGMGVSVISNTTSGDHVIHTNGFLNSTVRDISLWSVGGAGSQCYHFDEDVYTASGKSKELCWINVEFKGAENGLAVGVNGQCDVSLVLNCWVHDHAQSGIWLRAGNALSWVVQGGRVENCATGISIAAGSCPTIQGVYFANNTANDITNFFRTGITVIGCHSDSSASNGFIATNGPTKIIACTHTGTSGHFVNTSDSFLVSPAVINTVCLDACSSTYGTFTGVSGNKVYARGCSFAANAFTAIPFGGTVFENI